MYSNKEIERLIQERDRKIGEFNAQIQKEIDKEKAKYKFDWKWFLFSLLCVTLCIIGPKVNEKMFAKTSIWSWHYYKNFK